MLAIASPGFAYHHVMAVNADAPYRREAAYEPRLVQRIDTLEGPAGWRLKVYSVTMRDEPLDRAAFEPGVRLALDALPTPGRTQERPGVGFVILHQGQGWLYVVLAWWDRHNELPVRVWSRPAAEHEDWAPGRPDQGACVWDLQVFAFERDAFVKHVMSAPGGADLEAYLQASCHVAAPAP